MQERIVELLAKLPDGELTEQLLIVNDDLNNLFLRFAKKKNIIYEYFIYLQCIIYIIGIADMKKIENQDIAVLQ